MKQFSKILLSGVALLGLFSWSVSSLKSDDKNPNPAAPQSSEATIVIKDFKFVPAKTSFPAGTKITFINKDEEPHQVVSTDGAFASSQALDTDDKFSITLDKPGTFKYFCSIHPMMTGEIDITAAKPAK